jgi:hypothetical protein
MLRGGLSAISRRGAIAPAELYAPQDKTGCRVGCSDLIRSRIPRAASESDFTPYCRPINRAAQRKSALKSASAALRALALYKAPTRRSILSAIWAEGDRPTTPADQVEVWLHPPLSDSAQRTSESDKTQRFADDVHEVRLVTDMAKGKSPTKPMDQLEALFPHPTERFRSDASGSDKTQRSTEKTTAKIQHLP